MIDDVELRKTPERGEGVFALRSFQPGETVLVGVLTETCIGNHSHASQIGEQKFGFHSGLSSKFNHSCDPNCGIRLNSLGGHDFVAMRTIDAHEEATYDYAMRNFKIEHFPGLCLCGERLCRGSITGWRDLPQIRKTAYLGFVAPYLLEMDRALERGSSIAPTD